MVGEVQLLSKNKYMYANLIDQQRVTFESVKPKGISRKSYKINTKTIEDVVQNSAKRSQTKKNRQQFSSEKMVGGTYVVSKMPQGIGRIRQSLDQPFGNEPEDFGLNDTDERVTTQKKQVLKRNDDWKYENFRKVRFPVDLRESEKRYQEQLSKTKYYHKSNTYRSAPRNALPSKPIKSSITSNQMKINHKGERNIKKASKSNKYSLLNKPEKSDKKKRKNRKELNSFQDNVEDFDNLTKLANEHKKIMNQDVLLNFRDDNTHMNKPISRHSNPMTFSPHNSRMRELNNITESPEYKNTKYSDSKKNTITQKS